MSRSQPRSFTKYVGATSRNVSGRPLAAHDNTYRVLFIWQSSMQCRQYVIHI